MAGSKRAMMISVIMQRIMNVFLLGLAAILTLFLGRETYHLALVLFVNNDESSSYLLIEGIVIYFLYFEFIALIVKYFSSGYHFPLRYFIHRHHGHYSPDHCGPQKPLRYAGLRLCHLGSGGHAVLGKQRTAAPRVVESKGFARKSITVGTFCVRMRG